MGFWDVVSDFVSYAAKNNEQKIDRLERSGKISSEQANEAREKNSRAQSGFDKLTSMGSNPRAYFSSSSSVDENETFGGKTIEEWDSGWRSIGKLKDANLSPYNHFVGLYRHVVDGETVYLGRAVEYNNGGFRKRLSDYRRSSDSARTHTSGRTINSNLDKIETYILVVGSDKAAADLTKKLEPIFIKKYSPNWNKMLK